VRVQLSFSKKFELVCPHPLLERSARTWFCILSLSLLKEEERDGVSVRVMSLLRQLLSEDESFPSSL
jgi:hypothetical protein